MKRIAFSFFLIAVIAAGVCLNVPGVFVRYGDFSQSLNKETESGSSLIESLESRDAKQVQNKIDKAKKKREEESRAQDAYQALQETIDKIENGELSYIKAFRNVYIAGDSLAHGLKEYNIINSSHLITQVSASLYHLQEKYNTIVGLNPPVLILHYGLNMAEDSQARRDAFINQYTKIIKSLKKDLPNTRIIISQIFPLKKGADTLVTNESINKYNKAIVKMCKSLGVETLDSKPVFKIKDCYAYDGIHQSAEFYRLWLKYIMTDKGIF